LFENVNPPFIDPDTSKIITEFKILSSLGYPSSFPLRNRAINSFTYLFDILEGFDARQNPICKSATLSVFGPTSKSI
jgi:hypothetical protein